MQTQLEEVETKKIKEINIIPFQILIFLALFLFCGLVLKSVILGAIITIPSTFPYFYFRKFKSKIVMIISYLLWLAVVFFYTNSYFIN